jgi:hypothetical protein
MMEGEVGGTDFGALTMTVGSPLFVREPSAAFPHLYHLNPLSFTMHG